MFSYKYTAAYYIFHLPDDTNDLLDLVPEISDSTPQEKSCLQNCSHWPTLDSYLCPSLSQNVDEKNFQLLFFLQTATMRLVLQVREPA